MDMILPTISITLSSYIQYTLTHYNKQTQIFTASLPPPLSRMDYLLDEDIEIELLSAIAFEDDVLTQQEQPIEQHMDDTITIPDSLPFKQHQRGSYFLHRHCKPLNRGCSLPQ